jgi:hypothetical protein
MAYPAAYWHDGGDSDCCCIDCRINEYLHYTDQKYDGNAIKTSVYAENKGLELAVQRLFGTRTIVQHGIIRYACMTHKGHVIWAKLGK